MKTKSFKFSGYIKLVPQKAKIKTVYENLQSKVKSSGILKLSSMKRIWNKNVKKKKLVFGGDLCATHNSEKDFKAGEKWCKKVNITGI